MLSNKSGAAAAMMAGGTSGIYLPEVPLQAEEGQFRSNSWHSSHLETDLNKPLIENPYLKE